MTCLEHPDFVKFQRVGIGEHRAVGHSRQPVGFAANGGDPAPELFRTIVLDIGNRLETPGLHVENANDIARHSVARRTDRHGDIDPRNIACSKQRPFDLAAVQRRQRLQGKRPLANGVLEPANIAHYPHFGEARRDNPQGQHAVGNLLRGDLRERDIACRFQTLVHRIADIANNRNGPLALRRCAERLQQLQYVGGWRRTTLVALEHHRRERDRHGGIVERAGQIFKPALSSYAHIAAIQLVWPGVNLFASGKRGARIRHRLRSRMACRKDDTSK
ncbi:hypothetical protein ERY430_80104 [Erythrobacter sp. EC-HK427]|nr:hypothetical protein ERY430_80104 [Erythrobacter sp. EC-HK427]